MWGGESQTMYKSLDPLKEEEDPGPKTNYLTRWLNIYETKPEEDFEEQSTRVARETLERLLRRHYDEGHMINPDPTCPECKEMGLLLRV